MVIIVAPVLIHSFWILTVTTIIIQAILAAKINIFMRLLPIGSIMTNAAMHMPVVSRNIRSRRPILWSYIVSNHFFNTQNFLLFLLIIR